MEEGGIFMLQSLQTSWFYLLGLTPHKHHTTHKHQSCVSWWSAQDCSCTALKAEGPWLWSPQCISWVPCVWRWYSSFNTGLPHLWDPKSILAWLFLPNILVSLVSKHITLICCLSVYSHVEIFQTVFWTSCSITVYGMCCDSMLLLLLFSCGQGFPLSWAQVCCSSCNQDFFSFQFFCSQYCLCYQCKLFSLYFHCFLFRCFYIYFQS